MLNTSLVSNSTPKYFFDKLIDITPADIKNMGGRAIGIDLDNTCCYDSAYHLFPGIDDWLKTIKNADIPIIIISNTYVLRAKYFARRMGFIPYIGNAEKPKSKSFIKAAQILKTDISSFVMIGDQLFTDIQGANNSGAISVRVKYTKREILLHIRYRILRKKEEKYLINKGLGDKI